MNKFRKDERGSSLVMTIIVATFISLLAVAVISMTVTNIKLKQLGIKLLIKKGIVPIIITGRRSKIVTRRCEEIGITVLYQGVRDKADILKNVMAKYDCTPEQTVYIGDDMNDLSAMQTAGITFAPADCAAALLPYVDFVLTQKSGDAPVREAIDIILENRLTLSDYESI